MQLRVFTSGGKALVSLHKTGFFPADGILSQDPVAGSLVKRLLDYLQCRPRGGFITLRDSRNEPLFQCPATALGSAVTESFPCICLQAFLG